MSSITKLFGERVRAIRKERKLTQELLAERSGLQYTYIGGIERGERNISLQTVDKVATGLGVAPLELFKFNNLTPLDDYFEKEISIEAYKNMLLSRSKDEIKLLYTISNEILGYLDNKK